MNLEAMQTPPFYRSWVSSDLVNFTVSESESDILISAGKDLKNEARNLIRKARQEVKEYIRKKPDFETSLKPLPPDGQAPPIIRSMLEATHRAGVGPMAAVAGAVSEFTGKGLLEFTDQAILENGGDIFIKTSRERKVGIYAGESPLSGKIAISVKPGMTPLGICTSSGTVGHSLSFGKADAVTVVARDAVLADACATAACNMVKNEADIKKALAFAKTIEGVIGIVVIYGDRVGSAGEIELV